MENSREGLSVPTILTLVFVVLKLIGTITWSWWWVLSPLWIVVALVLFFVLLDFITGRL